MAKVHLTPIDKANWLACARLSLPPEEEKFVAPAVYTIAQSKFEEIHQLRAIYHEGTVVGMLAFCHEDEPEENLELYWLFRILIDKDHQDKGYGTAAIKLLTDEVRSLGGKHLRTMHRPENERARRVYQNLEFKEIGNLDDGDILYELQIC
ncbi:MAG: spermidine acetyltransferase [Verrucomicrobiales bacterium]|nr:spermidine acetyltransferase [Verrucomicrobiales bacterium]